MLYLGSPVGSDDFVTALSIGNRMKISRVLNMVTDMHDAVIALPLHVICLSAVLFTFIYGTTPPSRTGLLSAKLDTQQYNWLGGLLPVLPQLMPCHLRQVRHPIKTGGLGLTLPSDVVVSALLGSRPDCAEFVASMPGLKSAEISLGGCEALLQQYVTLDDVPLPHGEHRWDVRTLQTIFRRKSQHKLLTHVQEQHARLQWPAAYTTVGAHTKEDLITLGGRRSVTSPGESEWLLVLAVNHSVETGLFQTMVARRLRVSSFPEGAECPSC